MKKILIIVVAAFAMIACGQKGPTDQQKEQYEESLVEFETALNLASDALKTDSVLSSQDADDLAEMKDGMDEIQKNGTEEQQKRCQQLLEKYKTLSSDYNATLPSTDEVQDSVLTDEPDADDLETKQ